MLLGLINGTPVEHYVPWTFLFATALLATGVDAFARKPFNPVVLCVWFFGLAFCGTVGGWGVPALSAGAICLVTPHLLVCTFSGRIRSARAEAAASDHDGQEHATPIPLPNPDEPETDHGYRRVA
ncbi:MAG: hypothetical protein K8E66_12530 [Phycisphaerales bacterium]|nr:hypothetical protein [Phycisphaerales bacterium]